VDAKRLYLQENTGKLFDKPKQLWALLNTCLGRRKSTVLPSHSSAEVLSEYFNDFFLKKIRDVRASLATPNSIMVSPKSTVSLLVQFTPVTECEIKQIVHHAPRKSSPEDLLPSWLFIESLAFLLPSLAVIVNNALVDGLPAQLKHSQVTPLLKKPTLDPESMASYRPVANMSSLAKIVERVVLTRLLYHLNVNHLLDDRQSGFRQFYSCETVLLYVHDVAVDAMDNGQVTVLTLLDLSCAFDTVEHSILVQKLELLGIQGTAQQWFANYLMNRTQSVRIGDKLSAPKLVEFGVPQGSVLGPTLFSIYLAGIGDIMASHNVDYILFADDIQLLLTCTPEDVLVTLKRLEECIAELRCWLSDHFLSLNTSKTDLIIMGTKAQIKKCPSNPRLIVGDSSIFPSQKAVRDLGIMLDSTLSMSDHVSLSCGRAFSYIRAIHRLRHSLSYSGRMSLVKSLVFSQIDYGSVLLYKRSGILLARLTRVLHAGVKMALGLKKFDHVSQFMKCNGVLDAEKRIRYRLLNIIHKVCWYGNPTYLTQHLQEYIPKRQLRSSGKFLLCKYRTKMTTASGGFRTAAPDLWNSLPEKCRAEVSHTKFKVMIFELLMNE
jgi:hypothetical protein